LNSKIAKFKITNCIDVAPVGVAALVVVVVSVLFTAVVNFAACNFADWQAATAIALVAVVPFVAVIIVLAVYKTVTGPAPTPLKKGGTTHSARGVVSANC